MKPNELPTLAARLNELAEYFDKRPPGAAALRIWLDVLAECRMDDVLYVLTDWPKSHRQMPLADEILKACRARLSDRIEAEAARNQREAGTIGEVVANLARSPTPQAQRARQEIQAWMRATRGLARDPKAWARKLRDREQAGEILLDAQAKAWRYALRFEHDKHGEVVA